MANPPGAARTVLLVEDNAMDVELTRRAFARQALADRLKVVRDGQAALAFLEQAAANGELPALILLDLKLPKLTGLEVLRHVRAQPALRTLPVVMPTTSGEDRDLQAAYELGANSYIVKPVDFAKFEEVASQLDAYWLVLNTGPRAP